MPKRVKYSVHAVLIYHIQREAIKWNQQDKGIEWKYVCSLKGRDMMKNADSEGGIPDMGNLATQIPDGIFLPERRPPARRHR